MTDKPEEKLEAAMTEIARLEQMNGLLVDQINRQKTQIDMGRERNNQQAQKIQAQAATIREYSRDRAGMSNRIGQLAASNFALRLRAKTAEKQLKRLLKLDAKARKAGI